MKTTVDVVGRRDRATDKSIVARVGSVFLKWQWVLWILTWLYFAVGFTAGEVPSARLRSLESRVARVETRGDSMMSILRGLAIDACSRLHTNEYARDKLMCGHN